MCALGLNFFESAEQIAVIREAQQSVDGVASVAWFLGRDRTNGFLVLISGGGKIAAGRAEDMVQELRAFLP